jgi:hypothetical protein
LLGLAQREGIAITDWSGRRGVITADLDAYLERCRIALGSYGPGSVPYKGRQTATEVRHLDLLEAVAVGLSWSDARLAREVGVDPETVERWRSTGVPNGYLSALRALRDVARNGRLDSLDLAPLLPWGSRCRLEQARDAAGSARSRRRVALMDQSEGQVQLVGRRPRRRSGRRPL